MSQTAACCADFYEMDWVQDLLGDSLHPGGLDLSRRLWKSLALPPGARVLDVACGTGTSAVMVAQEGGARVVAVDFGAKNLASASARARQAGVASQLEFVEASATHMPLADGLFDAVLCECAVSTFDDKAAAASEFVRLLKPGGLLGISDMAVEREIPSDLNRILGPWTCVGDARSVSGYRELFTAAGLTEMSADDETESLREMLRDLKRKLVVAGLGGAIIGASGAPASLAEMRDLLKRARTLVDDGTVGYWRITFRKSA